MPVEYYMEEGRSPIRVEVAQITSFVVGTLVDPVRNARKEQRVSANKNDLLKSLSPDELANALSAVIGYITPLVESNPGASWEFHCPQKVLLEQDHDESWRQGQINGEVVAARRVLTAINKALNVSSPR